VVLKADVEGEAVEGQVAVQNSAGRKRRVEVVPSDAAAPGGAIAAIAAADQIVLAPGSLYTSLLPVLCVRDLGAAVVEARGRVVQVSNLRPQPPETTGLDATDHLLAVKEHGARVDVFLYQQDGVLVADDDVIRSGGVEPVPAAVARADGLVHDPGKLATALQALL
jgi:uncharacterized cofD-like protein